MRLILAAIVALALAGCATFSINNPIGLNQLAEAESTYGASVALFNGYKRLPLCKTGTTESITNVCARRSVIVKVQGYIAKAQIAVVNARLFVRNNPTLDPTSVITIAQSAVAALQAIEASNGVK